MEVVGASVNGQKYALHTKPQVPERHNITHWSSCVGCCLRKSPTSQQHHLWCTSAYHPCLRKTSLNLETAFPTGTWRLWGQFPAVCRYSKHVAIRGKRMLKYSPCFCSVPLPPCFVQSLRNHSWLCLVLGAAILTRTIG